jgi:hypothetical protein
MRGDGLISYGPDRIKTFLKVNGMTKIYRAHEMV